MLGEQYIWTSILQLTFGSAPGVPEPVFLLSFQAPFMNSPKVLAHLKDLLKTHIMSNLKHEMKIDAFNSCKDEDGKLPETVFLHFLCQFSRILML